MKKIKPIKFNFEKVRDGFDKIKLFKREKKFEEALKIIEFIDLELTHPNPIDRYNIKFSLDKERSIIYKKMKKNDKAFHYKLRSEMYCFINSCFRSMSLDHNSYYFKGVDVFGIDIELLPPYFIEYYNWFKPLGDELVKIVVKNQNKIDKVYLDYDYDSSSDLEYYLLTQNERFCEIVKILEDNKYEDFQLSI